MCQGIDGTPVSVTTNTNFVFFYFALPRFPSLFFLSDFFPLLFSSLVLCLTSSLLWFLSSDLVLFSFLLSSLVSSCLVFFSFLLSCLSNSFQLNPILSFSISFILHSAILFYFASFHSITLCSLLNSPHLFPSLFYFFNTSLIQMRTFMINEIKVGDEFIRYGPLSTYAADIPGMYAIGLGNSPSFILGMDVLRNNVDRMMIDLEMNKIYFSK